MFKGRASIIRWINVNTLYLSSIKGQQGFESIEVIALNYEIIAIVMGGEGGGGNYFSLLLAIGGMVY
jgi:hypothetical protein